MGTTGGRSRGRGSIDLLPSGAYCVRGYAGVDPLTGKQLMLTERVPPGPGADKEAERARTRLLSQVDERRNPRTRATLSQLLDRYLEVPGLLLCAAAPRRTPKAWSRLYRAKATSIVGSDTTRHRLPAVLRRPRTAA
jgi:hypothetical protein